VCFYFTSLPLLQPLPRPFYSFFRPRLRLNLFAGSQHFIVVSLCTHDRSFSFLLALPVSDAYEMVPGNCARFWFAAPILRLFFWLFFAARARRCNSVWFRSPEAGVFSVSLVESTHTLPVPPALPLPSVRDCAQKTVPGIAPYDRPLGCPLCLWCRGIGGPYVVFSLARDPGFSPLSSPFTLRPLLPRLTLNVLFTDVSSSVGFSSFATPTVLFSSYSFSCSFVGHVAGLQSVVTGRHNRLLPKASPCHFFLDQL